MLLYRPRRARRRGRRPTRRLGGGSHGGSRAAVRGAAAWSVLRRRRPRVYHTGAAPTRPDRSLAFAAGPGPMPRFSSNRVDEPAHGAHDEHERTMPTLGSDARSNMMKFLTPPPSAAASRSGPKAASSRLDTQAGAGRLNRPAPA